MDARARTDDFQEQFTTFVRTLDSKRATDADPSALPTCIQPGAKTKLSLARKPPGQGTGVPDVLQTALDKLRPPNHPRIDGRHVAWFPSLPVLFTAWVARGSLPFHDLPLFCAQFESVLEMPPPTASPVNKLPPEAPTVDFPDLEDQVSQAKLPEVADRPIPSGALHGHCDSGTAPDVSPAVLNGLPTWLNTVDDKQLGGLE